jgi:hypothetical protein
MRLSKDLPFDLQKPYCKVNFVVDCPVFSQFIDTGDYRRSVNTLSSVFVPGRLRRLNICNTNSSSGEQDCEENVGRGPLHSSTFTTGERCVG